MRSIYRCRALFFAAAFQVVPFVIARTMVRTGNDPFALLGSGNIATKAGRCDDDDDNDNDDDDGPKRVRGASSTAAAEHLIPEHQKPGTCSVCDGGWRRRWAPRVLLAQSRRAMSAQLIVGRWQWLKIFALAAIPNALFDLCGMVSQSERFCNG